MRSTLVAAALLVSGSILGSACVADSGTASSELAGDPMQACPIPALGDIPGHEAVFYQCAEQYADHGNGCGPDGYLIGYGTKYAQRFYDQARPKMTARGQVWIDHVLVCLQHDLRDAIDSSTSCDDIWNTAFDSHPQCYIENGFCSLSPWDIAQVVWTIDTKDFLSQDAARQVVQTAIGCGGEYARWMRFWFWYLV